MNITFKKSMTLIFIPRIMIGFCLLIVYISDNESFASQGLSETGNEKKTSRFRRLWKKPTSQKQKKKVSEPESFTKNSSTLGESILDPRERFGKNKAEEQLKKHVPGTPGVLNNSPCSSVANGPTLINNESVRGLLAVDENFKIEKRKKILQELETTETIFHDQLTYLIQKMEEDTSLFISSIAVDLKDMYTLLNNIKDSSAIYIEKIRAYRNGTGKIENFNLPEDYLDSVKRISLFHKKFLGTYKIVKGLNAAYITFETNLKNDIKPNLDFEAFLITPIQRGPRLEMLYKELIKSTPDREEFKEEKVIITETLDQIKTALNETNAVINNSEGLLEDLYRNSPRPSPKRKSRFSIFKK